MKAKRGNDKQINIIRTHKYLEATSKTKTWQAIKHDATTSKIHNENKEENKLPSNKHKQ